MEVALSGDGSGAALGPAVVTVGVFDGVHLGHRVIIADVVSVARERGMAAVVVTFDPHPATVVRPQSAPPLLCDLDQRLELLAAAGVDATVVVRFDAAMAAMEAEDFVRSVLVAEVGANVVVVGEDFHFGHGRRGNLAMLQRLGAEEGFEARGVALAGNGVEVVSSSAIRAFLTAGEVENAAAMLGRPHEIRGEVEKGDHRGSGLGFPTANVAVPEGIALPAQGVYAGWCSFPGGGRPAAISLGARPTYYPDGAPTLLEAHLLDFDGDLYGAVVAVRFVEHLRGQLRLSSSEELVARIEADVAATRQVMSGEQP